jgi:hypothetical protein
MSTKRELIARALYEDEWEVREAKHRHAVDLEPPPPWPDLPDWLNADAYRRKADAVIEAIRDEGYVITERRNVR